MATKHILGLDLGVGSIGWALIESEEDSPKRIVGMGSRIVPLTKDDSDQFSKGQAITKNADRTAKRTARKGYDRYQMRRAILTQVLRQNDMLPERMDEHVMTLWQLRADAATEGCQLTLSQIGRVLYHINQKRGYKHAKADMGDSKQTKYVEAVNQRYQDLQALHKTIGQYFADELRNSAVHSEKGDYFTFRIKDKVFPRQAYIEEFDQIMRVQKAYHPDVLTDELIDTLRNRIIFYQRPLKSCKHLVSLCEFEMKPYKNQQGKIIYSGPKVAPRTSPLAQLCSIWETVNNIQLENRNGEKYQFILEERKKMVDFLLTHEKMGVTDLQKILGVSKKDGWWGGKAIGKGIKGATTFISLRKALGEKYDTEKLLTFNLPMQSAGLVDVETGEEIQMISPSVEEQPLYRLWHIVYSIQDKDELRKALSKQLGIDDEEVVENLFALDFVKPGYANKSHKFIRKILPYLMQDYQYSEACTHVGFNHSGSMTKEENMARTLKPRLELLQKNELRQPIVEKILNQMINIVNALVDEYGAIDEIRVELARELKMSKDERNEADKRNRDNERQNQKIAVLIEEQGMRPTRIRIQKYKMWEESQHQCFYCGKTIGLAEFLNGADVEVEHIIPRSVLFDDSFSNKVCACRECNMVKGNQTALDFITSRGEGELEAYKNRVDDALKSGRISKTKRDHLMWHMAEIPQDFIDRQLRQSQYIARKAVEILSTICREVHATSGSVTDFLRHQWGYDEVLHTLNFPKYSAAGLTDIRESDGKERIHGWSKRLDHRHHAVDALTIALTRQSYIQRLNTLNASREVFFDEIQQSEAKVRNEEKRSLLEKWVQTRPHFSTAEVTDMVDGILVSFRAGKKVTSPAKRAIYCNGKRKTVQTGLLVPRGALTEETVYGKIGDQFVVKYKLVDLKVTDLNSIVDPTIRDIVRTRLEAFGGNPKAAFAKPLYSDAAQTMEIKSVRCYTGIQEKSVAPVRFNEMGEAIGFSKMGNNHHIAIYQDATGKYREKVVSFWSAVERKHYGLPVVIENPREVWNLAMNKELPQNVLESLPLDDYCFMTSMQLNEMFILGMDEANYEEAMANKDYRMLNKYLYRVQSLSESDYFFRYHTETTVDDKYDGEHNAKLSVEMKKLIRIKSVKSFMAQNPHKVKVNLLGEISAL